jgi:hypothetical protein
VQGFEGRLEAIAPGRALGDRGQELDGRRRADDPLVILRSSLQTVRGRVGGGPQLGHVQILEEVVPAVQHPDVRSVELIRRAGQEVAAHQADIDQAVRGVMHGIDEHEGADVVGQAGSIGHVVDRAQGVRSRPDRQQPRAARDLPPEVVSVELTRLRDHSGDPHGDAPLAGQLPPGIDVGVMVELGYDDLVAGAEPPPQRARQVERQGRHVRPEGDLRGRGVEEIGEGLA